LERVKRLTEETINKIAAGEVIDRPASVLKELVENSLDAAASRVSINIADAGLSLIEVSDNGRGMEPGDLRLALLRHTTSKIEDVTALASIASVSKMEIASIPEGRHEGIEIIADGGKIVGERPVTGDYGTVVKVRDLFFNTPARKKFLKSRKVEQTGLKSVFWDLAIPCTGVDFIYRSDGSDLTTVPADVATPARVRLRESEIGDTLQDFTEVSPYFGSSYS
jgi:DNA mismatch repair protein MutL